MVTPWSVTIPDFEHVFEKTYIGQLQAAPFTLDPNCMSFDADTRTFSSSTLDVTC